MSYINKEILKSSIITNVRCIDVAGTEMLKDIIFAEQIDYMPTVESLERRHHGRWEMYETYYRCSVCKSSDAFGLTPYCKWCGAKMDKEKENQNDVD